MVSVGIVGILATVAVPQYTKFRARALQSEAKVFLGTAYIAEKAFFAETGSYSVCLKALGASPEENSPNRYYAVGTLAETPKLTSGGGACDPGVAGDSYWSATKAPPGVSAAVKEALTRIDTSFSTMTFSVGAYGYIKDSRGDGWTIDQNQQLKNVLSGI